MSSAATQEPSYGVPGRRKGSVHLETFLSVVLIVWLIVGTFTHDLVFRTFAGMLPGFVALAAASALVALRNGLALRGDGPYPALYIFTGAGAFALVLSFLGYPDIGGLPRSDRFIIRQAYFLVLLPVTLMAGFVFWRRLYPWLYEFSARYFVPLSLAIMLGDLISAYYFGDPLFREINGYSKFANKLTLYFIFLFIFMARITHPRRYSRFFPFVLITVYLAATKLLTYGSLFQASTGLLFAFYLLIALLLRNRPILFAQVFLLVLACVIGIVVVGTVSPELFSADKNAVWRFTNWRSNFQTLHETGYLGIGFGTPYFPITTQDLENALTIFKRGSEPWSGKTEIYDLVYLRAQHNSFVNMFFRTGLAGGLSFLAFNLILLTGLMRKISQIASHNLPHLQTAYVLLVAGITQAMLHVGLETPRFLIVYALTVALVLLLTWHLKSEAEHRHAR